MARRKPQRQQQKAAPSITADQRAANIRLALGRAQDQSTRPRFTAPALMPGVVPKGETAAIAMDSCAATYQYASEALPMDFKPFPGYPYLANLSTRTEYRAFAATMSSELFREWITFSGANTGTSDAIQDEERIGQLEDAIRRHNLQGVFRLAAEHDCLFGRAQVLPKIKSADLSLPMVLSPKTIKQGSLEGFANIEAIWTTPSAYNAIDPTAPDFYKPREWWMLGERVHASRILTIVSRQLPDILKPAYNFSGMSLSQLAEPYVNNWLRTRQAISDLINNFSITGLKTNMAQTLQGNCDGADVFARADLFTLTRSNRGLMLLDFEHEDLVQVNTPITGLHELQAQSQEHMCSATRIPAMILTGISPTGMNASSEGEMRSFYDWISSQQEAHWRFPLDTCIKLIMLDLWGEIDETITWDFDPLWQPSDKELAEIRTANANADGVYIDRGVLSQEESRKRLANDKSSGYAGIDVSEVPEQPEPEPMMTGFGNEEATDESVSPEQHRAMEAAAHGKSALGIPKSAGEEFVKKDAA